MFFCSEIKEVSSCKTLHSLLVFSTDFTFMSSSPSPLFVVAARVLLHGHGLSLASLQVFANL
jgi:hypothetical protein